MKCASPSQTKTFAMRKTSELGLSSDAYNILGRTNLTCSHVGFGAYRVGRRDPAHSQALHMAIQQGCNLIDTSTNYADGDSELAIGAVLEKMQQASEVDRDELIVVSKVGYIQGHNLQAARSRENPWPELVRYSDDCWHCIHPEFIASQLSESLARLRLKCIDVYLLHNPEYFFLAHKSTDQNALKELRHHFYQRIRAAFLTLEEMVEQGFIRSYGISSNTFAMPLDHPESVSLEAVWNIAEEESMRRFGQRGKHHFSVVQFPMNLLETDAVHVDQGGKTLLDLVRTYNLGSLVNRPLNAFTENRMVRLIDLNVPEAPPIADQLDALLKLEKEYDEKLVPQFKNPVLKETGIWPWAEQLRLIPGRGYQPADLDGIEHEVIRPQTRQLIQQIDGLVSEDEMEAWALWRARYWPQLLQTLAFLHLEIQSEQKRVIDQLSGRMNAVKKEAWEKTSLASMAIALPASMPGINCVLSGMRLPRYVASSLAVLRRGLVAEPEKFFTE